MPPARIGVQSLHDDILYRIFDLLALDRPDGCYSRIYKPSRLAALSMVCKQWRRPVQAALTRYLSFDAPGSERKLFELMVHKAQRNERLVILRIEMRYIFANQADFDEGSQAILGILDYCAGTLLALTLGPFSPALDTRFLEVLARLTQLRYFWGQRRPDKFGWLPVDDHTQDPFTPIGILDVANVLQLATTCWSQLTSLTLDGLKSEMPLPVEGHTFPTTLKSLAFYDGIEGAAEAEFGYILSLIQSPLFGLALWDCTGILTSIAVAAALQQFGPSLLSLEICPFFPAGDQLQACFKWCTQLRILEVAGDMPKDIRLSPTLRYLCIYDAPTWCNRESVLLLREQLPLLEVLCMSDQVFTTEQREELETACKDANLIFRDVYMQEETQPARWFL